MNASVRWSQYFVNELECVKCRSTSDLVLHEYSGKPVDPETKTIEELKWMVDRMDVWCPKCPVKVNKRVAGPGRKARKEEAVVLADIRCRMAIGSKYDDYVIDGGKTLTKQQLIEEVKYRPCMVCGQSYPNPVMEFHHVVFPKVSSITSMPSQSYTIRDVIEEIEKCVLLCANCHRLVESGLADAPKTKIELDGNFWGLLA